MKSTIPLLFMAILANFSAISRLQAGIYLPGEPLEIPRNATFSQVRLILSELGALSIPDDASQQQTETSLRPIYIEMRKNLEAKLQAGQATPEEKLKLGGCFLRLNQPAKAIACLESARKNLDSSSPLQPQFCFNLAMAFSFDDLFLDRAIDMQKQGLQFSTKSSETSFSKWNFQRRTELFYLKLLQEKQFARDRKINDQNTISSIFGNFQSEWKKNKFSSGSVSINFLDSFPPDALDLAIKLLSYRPQDNNLFWLYGELLNAMGDSSSASKVLDELVNARQMSSNPELFEHARSLRRFTLELNEQKSLIKIEQKEEPQEPESSTNPRTSLFSGDLKYLLVGVITGMIAGYIFQLQLRHWFKRK